jgi:hypothetical protein
MAEDNRAYAKMEERIGEKLPCLKLITPGLSIKVKTGLSMKGPILEGELPKCLEFGRKIATQHTMIWRVCPGSNPGNLFLPLNFEIGTQTRFWVNPVRLTFVNLKLLGVCFLIVGLA